MENSEKAAILFLAQILIFKNFIKNGKVSYFSSKTLSEFLPFPFKESRFCLHSEEHRKENSYKIKGSEKLNKVY